MYYNRLINLKVLFSVKNDQGKSSHLNENSGKSQGNVTEFIVENLVRTL